MSSNIQNKLLQYEVLPRPGLWEEIETALDNGAGSDFSEKLFSYEEVPDESNWERIESALPSEEARVIPFITRYRKPLQYTGSFFFLILAGTILSLFISKKTISEVPQQESLVPSALEKQDAKKFPEEKTNASVSSLRNIPRNAIIIRPPFHRTSFSFISLPFLINTENSLSQFIPDWAKGGTIEFDSRTNDYMVYTDDSGYAAKMPKKIFDLISCPAGDEGCKERLKKLRQDFISSDLSSDFTGVLEILRHLQENQ